MISSAQVSKLWVADNGDGTYKNPVINADYSDPDAIRVGNDYYMISSSFNHVPGLPILHSKDLVNWQLIGHALKKLTPEKNFDTVRHGGGVWAPSIRYHNNEFYIYYPDPDFGIYLIKSKNINGPWSEPVMVQAGKGLIDPCPLWDDDGKVYLVHAFAGSRAGIKSVIVVKELNKEGTKIIGDPVLVYDGHEKDPTIEGPKFYKRNGYYYIFAPAGGVSTGWQTVLRSKKVYGPYERKVVMEQGTTKINGPHQGAWVNTTTGEDWFLHFQDKEAYGRVVHLQPMKWVNDWPVIGTDKDGDGKGEPVLVYKKPNVGKTYPLITPAESDEFNDHKLGLQWQWQSNAGSQKAFMTGEALRLYAYPWPDSAKNLWDIPSIVAQKFPADEFMVTAKVSFYPKKAGDMFGLIVFGTDYATMSFQWTDESGYYRILPAIVKNADKGSQCCSISDERKKITAPFYARVIVKKGAVCSVGYSVDAVDFKMFDQQFTAKPGRWVGAKLGLFCVGAEKTNDSGYADVDWFRVEPVK